MSSISTDRTPAWRDALAILAVAPAPVVGVLMGLGDHASLGAAGFIGGKLWMFLLPTWWYLCVDRRPRSFSPARHGGFVAGTLIGLAISVAIGLGTSLGGVTRDESSM